MSTESNKGLIRQGFEDGINKGRLDVFERIIGPQYVNHAFPAAGTGPAAFRQTLEAFTSAFPDLHVTIEDIVAEADRVVTRGFFTGTHRGSFLNVPATNNSVKVPYLDMWRIEGGQAVENWVQMDLLGLLQQLGAMPASR